MQNLTSSPQSQIMSLELRFWQARTLALATELGVADHLAEGPLDVTELANRTKTNASALFRLLRALESIGIFLQVSPRVFVNTEISEYLRQDVKRSQRPWIMHALSMGHGPCEAWNYLDYSVRTAEASLQEVYGFDIWELFRRKPESNMYFNDAMRAATQAMTSAVTVAYDWSRFAVIADIGGGIGTQLVSILEASPSSTGILFDQAHVVSIPAIDARIEVINGDFFKAVPEGADAYLLRFVLHDWDDSKALAILA